MIPLRIVYFALEAQGHHSGTPFPPSPQIFYSSFWELVDVISNLGCLAISFSYLWLVFYYWNVRQTPLWPDIYSAADMAAVVEFSALYSGWLYFGILCNGFLGVRSYQVCGTRNRSTMLSKRIF